MFSIQIILFCADPPPLTINECTNMLKRPPGKGCAYQILSYSSMLLIQWKLHTPVFYPETGKLDCFIIVCSLTQMGDSRIKKWEGFSRQAQETLSDLTLSAP